jgi:CRP/FNR family transcriptional regulator, anaerobic regulatory protein
MSDTNNNTACRTCDFTSFCGNEIKEPSKSKHINDTVKQHKHFRRKELLCLANDKFLNLYAIKKGVVKTFQVDSEGNELIRRFYFQGEVLGYEAIGSGSYPYSAIALCETVVCEIPYEHFIENLQPKPAHLKHLLGLMSRQLTAGSYLEMNTAEQRLAAFILDLSTRLHCDKPIANLVLPMSRQDIGNYLRLASETVSRIFSRLQKNKIIEINHKNIRILRPHKLVEIADAAT